MGNRNREVSAGIDLAGLSVCGTSPIVKGDFKPSGAYAYSVSVCDGRILENQTVIRQRPVSRLVCPPAAEGVIWIPASAEIFYAPVAAGHHGRRK